MSTAEERRMQRFSPAIAPSPATAGRGNFPGIGVPQQSTVPPMRERSSGLGGGTQTGAIAQPRVNTTTLAGVQRASTSAAPASVPASNAGSTVNTGPTGNLNSTPSRSPSGAGTANAPASGTSDVDAAALLDAEIARILEGDFIGFQGSQANELRRLQNLRNQLFGDAEFGSTGSVQRQEEMDSQARRRLASQRAMSGMLQGGAYAGLNRGVGTVQRAEQDFGIQEMLRPFREQTQSDRLREFGLGFNPEGREFDLYDFGSPDNVLGGWSTSTFAGREAASRARNAAIERLRQQGMVL